jgi:hypothetical protein
MSALPPTLNDQLVQLVFSLANLKVDVPLINYSLPVLDVLFAILINYSYRSALGVSHSQVGWYQGLLATLVMATGGGCTVSVLRGEPIGILKSNEFWGIHWYVSLIVYGHCRLINHVLFLVLLILPCSLIHMSIRWSIFSSRFPL